MILVTPEVSLPVGFEIYQPDPAKQSWQKEDKKLKQQGIAKKQRSATPANHPDYPSKAQLALKLMRQFRQHHAITIKAVVADALHGRMALTYGNEPTTPIKVLEKKKILLKP